MSVIALLKQSKYIGIRELRKNLSTVIRDQHTFFVTEHGKPAKAMLPYQIFLELLDMLEELKDTTLVREIAQGRKEYQKGGWIPATKMKKLLGHG